MAAVDRLAMYDKTEQSLPNARIEEFAPLVKRIAYHMMMRMPASVQVDDLIQAGMIGLIEAAQKYDSSKGASFETYAGIRIRGSIVEYFSMLQDSNCSRLYSYEETFGEEDSNIDASETSSAFASPLEGLQREGLKKALSAAIVQLPERERMVLALYYNEELNLKEIGLVLGVSESRVSQIHSQAAARLKARLAGWHSKG
jgi:RNA polymerase sigma factor for flagellar operon FliA